MSATSDGAEGERAVCHRNITYRKFVACNLLETIKYASGLVFHYSDKSSMLSGI